MLIQDVCHYTGVCSHGLGRRCEAREKRGFRAWWVSMLGDGSGVLAHRRLLAWGLARSWVRCAPFTPCVVARVSSFPWLVMRAFRSCARFLRYIRNSKCPGRIARKLVSLRRSELPIDYLGPIWLPGFGFAYCSVLILEFSRSHYCDRGVQCNITWYWDNIPNTGVPDSHNAHDAWCVMHVISAHVHELGDSCLLAQGILRSESSFLCTMMHTQSSKSP